MLFLQGKAVKRVICNIQAGLREDRADHREPYRREKGAGTAFLSAFYSTVTDFARFLGLSTSSPRPRET